MTPHIRRRIVLLGALAAVALGPALPSPAVAQDSGAVAINTRDGSSIFRLAFNIRRVTDDVVDDTNAAVAYASCAECRAVAISIQVLLVASDPSVVSPENLALAYNQDCTLCNTFASAYQLVLGDGTLLRFTAEGSQSIAQIRRELEALRSQDLSNEELAGQLDAIVDRLRGVLDTELLGVGKPTKPAPEATPSATQAPTETAPDQAAPVQTTPAPPPAQTTTTPVETTPEAPPAQATPSDTSTAPAPTQTTP